MELCSHKANLEYLLTFFCVWNIRRMGENNTSKISVITISENLDN